MKRLCVFSITLLWNYCAFAHHWVVDSYDEHSLTTVEMEVVEFRFINPHPFIIARLAHKAASESNQDDTDLWTLEMDNRWELAELGFTEDALEPGDLIIVSANPSPYDARALYVRAMDHPVDGYRYEHNVRNLFKLQNN